MYNSMWYKKSQVQLSKVDTGHVEIDSDSKNNPPIRAKKYHTFLAGRNLSFLAAGICTASIDEKQNVQGLSALQKP